MTAVVTIVAMDWNRLIGTGSSGLIVGRLHMRSLDTELSVRGVNEENYTVGLLHADLVAHISREGSGVGSSVNCLLIAATLSVKNEAKVSAIRLVAGRGGGGLNFRLSVVL